MYGGVELHQAIARAGVIALVVTGVAGFAAGLMLRRIFVRLSRGTNMSVLAGLLTLLVAFAVLLGLAYVQFLMAVEPFQGEFIFTSVDPGAGMRLGPTFMMMIGFIFTFIRRRHRDLTSSIL